MHKHWQNIITLTLTFVFLAILGSFLLGILIKYQVVDVIIATPITYIINALITQSLMFGGTAFLYLKITDNRFKEYVKFSKPDKKDWFLTGTCFIVAISIVIVFSPLLEFIQTHFKDHPWIISQLETTNKQNAVIASLRGYKLPIALFIFAVLPALFEELVFRGILYKVLRDFSQKKWLSIILSAFIFAVVHFQILSFMPIFVIGILLAYLYERTNNLITACILHFLFNAIQIVFWQG